MTRRDYFEVVRLVKTREYHRLLSECDRRKAELDILWNLCRGLGDHEAAMEASKFPKGVDVLEGDGDGAAQ